MQLTVSEDESLVVAPWSGSLYRIVVGSRDPKRFESLSGQRFHARDSVSGKVIQLHALREVYGRFLIAEASPDSTRSQDLPAKLDRRANFRFAPSRNFPILAFPNLRRSKCKYVYTVKNISASGALLVCGGATSRHAVHEAVELRFEANGTPPFVARIEYRSEFISDHESRWGVEFLDLEGNAYANFCDYLRRSATDYDLDVLAKEGVLAATSTLPAESSPACEIRPDFLRQRVWIDASRATTKSPLSAHRALLYPSFHSRGAFLRAAECPETRRFYSPTMHGRVNPARRSVAAPAAANSTYNDQGHPNPPTCTPIGSAELGVNGVRQAVLNVPLHVLARRPKRSTFNQRSEVSWSLYAAAYDLMCRSNAAYLDNLSLFSDWLKRSHLQHDAIVCDVGAGTGNYLLKVHEHLPGASLIHVDSDARMTTMASKKYRRAGITRVAFEKRPVQDVEIPHETLDLAICVNALYAFPDHSSVLRKLHRWLKPQGLFFAIDLGREMNVAEWTRFILSSSVQDSGLAQTTLRLWKGRHAIFQNSAIRTNQLTGKYWLHHSRDFDSALREAGFQVLESGVCYRGYCDFAVCSKGSIDPRV